MEYVEVIKLLENTFSSYLHPGNVLKFPDMNAFQFTEIQKDFGNLNREEMTYENKFMMLNDITLLNTKAILYFLPQLYSFTIENYGYMKELGNALEEIYSQTTDESLLRVLKIAIESLRKLEEEFDKME